MSNVQKTLQMTSLLFGMIMLFSYIAWSLGYEGFIIVGHLPIPEWVLYGICPIFLCINWSLITGFVLHIYSWKVLYFSVPMAVISAIGSIWLPAIWFSGFLPTIVLAIAIFRSKYANKEIGFRNLIIATVIPIIFQWMTAAFSVIDLSVNISPYQAIRLSINNIFLNLLLYSIGGARYAKRLEQLVFPGRTRDDRNRNDSSQSNSQSAESIPVDDFEKWVMRSVIGVVQVIQWMFILWVCNLDNLFLDALVMTTSFICHGMIINKRMHLKPIVLCTLAATAMFYFAARFTVSFQYSQFFPIAIGLILAYTVYRISYQFEMAAQAKAKNDLERIAALERKIAAAWDKLDGLS